MSVLVLAAIGAIFGLSLLRYSRQAQTLFERSTAGRNVAQAITVFANQTRTPIASPLEVAEIIAFDGSVPTEMLDPSFFAPRGFVGPWWMIASDPSNNDFSASRILLYENPDLNTSEIMIVFNDAHVQVYPRHEALALVEQELAASRARDPVVTWPVPLSPR